MAINPAFILIGVLLAVPTSAAAQSTDDDSAFDFSLPGARSRGIAGAFVAIADDATSVYSNPAGLTSLFRPELSLEFRHWSITSTAIDRGHAYGLPRNIGLDTLSGVHERTFDSELNGISFGSFAFPRNKWAVGIFEHQLARYSTERRTQGIFFDCVGGKRGHDAAPPYCDQSATDGVDRLYPHHQTFDLSIRSTGLALAVETDAPKRLSVGLTLQYSVFDLNATRRVYAARGELKYAAPNYSVENLELEGRRTGDDWALSVNAGILYDLTEQLTVGATFRQGPKFDYYANTITGHGNGGAQGVLFVDNLKSPFKVPDTWAAGIAYRPNNAWRVSVEVDQVLYSQLLDQIANTAHDGTDPEGLMVVHRLTIHDGTQVRLGGEYTMSKRGLLWSLRGGAWYDPLHRPYLSIDNPNSGWPAPGWSLLFPKRDDEIHSAGGIGIATQRRFQLNGAVDHSPSLTTYSISAIWRF